jgi:hypothetical protein
MRASFAVAPYENWAHSGGSPVVGGDIPGAISSIHWGPGSALASVEMHSPWLRDAYVNLDLAHGVGVNGCAMRSVNVSLGSSPPSVSIDLVTEFEFPAPLTLRADTATLPDNFEFALAVSGETLGLFSVAELRAGVPVPLKPTR